MGIVWVDRERLVDAAHVDEKWTSTRLALAVLMTGPIAVVALCTATSWMNATAIVGLGLCPYLGVMVALSDSWDWRGRRRRDQLYSATGTIVAPVPGEPAVTAGRMAIPRHDDSLPLPPPGEYRVTWYYPGITGATLLAVESLGAKKPRGRVSLGGPDRLALVAVMLFCLNLVCVLSGAVTLTRVALDNENPAGAVVFTALMAGGIAALWTIPARLLIADWLRTRKTARWAAGLLSPAP